MDIAYAMKDKRSHAAVLVVKPCLFVAIRAIPSTCYTPRDNGPHFLAPPSQQQSGNVLLQAVLIQAHAGFFHWHFEGFHTRLEARCNFALVERVVRVIEPARCQVHLKYIQVKWQIRPWKYTLHMD